MKPQTNQHLHPVFGEMFDKIFGLPPISKPDPLPELTTEQLAEGDQTEQRR